ncbi:G0/G1 switch protein 2 [Parambassis ranga]|uniref:G0/G1 switch protein 2 n=1 Tax=Parambassis ranga TaxID=210632 RepID=A0A6P7IKS9_9TELE|nr:G0/G1 switch protein 2-like [Parambassis ranga]
MENLSEIIPFAKEMLNQKPNRRMLKIYLLGSSLAVLGMVSGVVETIFLPFVDGVEDEPAEISVMTEKKKKKVEVDSHTSVVDTEVMQTAMIEVKAKHLPTAAQRSNAHRLHAS